MSTHSSGSGGEFHMRHFVGGQMKILPKRSLSAETRRRRSHPSSQKVAALFLRRRPVLPSERDHTPVLLHRLRLEESLEELKK
jgi:hypothetical protein